MTTTFRAVRVKSPKTDYPRQVTSDAGLLGYWRLNERSAQPFAGATYPTVQAESAFNNTFGATDPWFNNGGGSGVLGARLLTAVALTGYTIHSWDHAVGPSRAPSAWTFEGSNNGSSWTTLDTRSGQTSWVWSTPRSFSFSNTTPYLYYRLNISADNGGGYLAIAEVQFTPAPEGLPVAPIGFDSSGNARHMSLAAVPNSFRPVCGSGSLLGNGSGDSMLFDGVDDYLSIANAGWMNAAQMTIEARVKTLASGGSWTLTRWGTGTEHGFLFNASATSPSATVNIGGTERTLTTIGTLTAGTVHTVALTYDGLTLKMYIDGVLNNSAAYTGSVTFASAPLEIGRAAYAAWSANHAAELSFYDNALSPTRLAARHAAAIAA